MTHPSALLHAKRLCLIPLLAVSGGCERYEPPCEVGSQGVVLDELAQGAMLEPLPDGTVVVSWLRYDSAPGGDPSVPAAPTGLDVAVVDRDGQVAERHFVTAPAELAERKGSTEGVSAVWTAERTVFHWVEESVTVAANGAETTSSRLRIQFGDGAGTVNGADAFTIDCEDCVIRASAVRALAGVRVLFSHRPRQGLLGSEAARLDVGFVLASPDGIFTSGKVPWLESLPAVGAATGGWGSSTFTNVGGHPELRQVAGTPLVITQAHGVWAVDDALEPIAGPLLLTDSALAMLEWNVGLNRVATASTGAAEGSVGEAPDLYFRAFDNDGAPLHAPQRFSTGLDVRALASSSSDYGVVFATRSTQYFAILDPSGVKVGGDLALPTQPSPGPPSLDALGGAWRASEWLAPRSEGGYVRLAIDGSRAVRTEIVCAR